MAEGSMTPGYRGTPETNDLLQQLMGILEKNRAERQSGEQQQARLNASSGFAQGLSGGLGKGKPAAEAPAAQPPEEPLVRPGAAGGTSKDRVGIGQRYIDAQRAKDPYGVYLAENDTYAPNPTEQAIQEERKKRFTQNLMMQRGQTGGPLGGAGAPPPMNTPTTAGIDPSVVNAVSGAGGPVPQMNPAPAAMPTAATAMPTPAAAQGGFGGTVMPTVPPNNPLLEWAAARQAEQAARGM